MWPVAATSSAALKPKHLVGARMKTFNINSRQVEFDETLEYADFWVEGPKPCLAAVNWNAILVGLQSGEYTWTQLGEHIKQLSRWVHEAPRKRHYRQMKLDGFSVLSGEFFFENWDKGAEFINALENTGKLAARVCEAYSVEPMRPLNWGFADPIPGDKLEQFEDKTSSAFKRNSR